VIPTLSVTEYPPFLLARLVNSLDHVTEGRVGWNCVTSSNDGAAQMPSSRRTTNAMILPTNSPTW
jgi:alkanesulfonate monooxygenase SsuD/methylene tetrahydromethanopterin reductase-like flavin-dependent oxidoreductase (luciferase family)